MEQNQTQAEIWHANYQQVRDFFNKHGHLSVRDKKLAMWLTHQRTRTKLNSVQLELLKKIKFQDPKLIHRKDDKKSWESKAALLKEYKGRNDSSGTKDNALQLWLTRQRRLCDEGKLLPERRKTLEDLGVNLQLNKRISESKKISESNQKKWMLKFEKLLEYKKENGHCKVPRNYTKDGLGSWVKEQKHQAKKWKESDDSKLQYRVEQLMNIGVI